MPNTTLKQKALELKQQGLSYQQIADELGIGKTTVYNWIVYANDSNDNDSLPEPSSESMGLEELKAEIAQLRQYISAGISDKNDKSFEFELRKLELEHEFRMEELDNLRLDNLLKKERDEMERQRDGLIDRLERANNKANELSETIEQQQSELEDQQQYIAELEEKVTMLKDQRVAPYLDMETDTYIAFFVTNTTFLISEYVEMDGAVCTIDLLEAIVEKATNFKIDAKEWAEKNEFDGDVYDNIVMLEKLIEEVTEAIHTYDSDDPDEFILEIDTDWKAEADEWLETA